MRYAAPVECDVPLASALQPGFVAAAYFCDSYRAPLTTPPAGVVELFFGIFDHHPRWIKLALVLRNRIASRCGLSVPAEAEVLNPQRRQHYEARKGLPLLHRSASQVGRQVHHLEGAVRGQALKHGAAMQHARKLMPKPSLERLAPAHTP